MSEGLVKTLQTRVKSLALVLVFLHSGLLAMDVIIHMLSLSYGFVALASDNDQEMLSEAKKGMIGITKVPTLGIISGIGLFIGAKKKNKLLLVSFMLLMALELVLLCLCTWYLAYQMKRPNVLQSGILIFLIIVIVWCLWTLYNAKELYKKLPKTNESLSATERLGGQVDGPDNLDNRHLLNYLSDFRQANTVSNISNEQPLHVNETSATPDVNQYDIHASLLSEPPPQYSEAAAILTKRDDVPPTYDEAMAMSK